MLANYWRFTARNSLGQTIAIAGVKVTGRTKKLDSEGAIVFGASTEFLNNAGTLANGAYLSSTAVDNGAGAALWLGGDFTLQVTAPASASGSVFLYFETSPDNSIWPTNGAGLIVAQADFTAAGSLNVDFSL